MVLSIDKEVFGTIEVLVLIRGLDDLVTVIDNIGQFNNFKFTRNVNDSGF